MSTYAGRLLHRGHLPFEFETAHTRSAVLLRWPTPGSLAYAQTQLGVVYTSETPAGMRSGWRELFVERAYGTSGQYARAIYDFSSQQSARRIHTGTNPPAGALVFY